MFDQNNTPIVQEQLPPQSVWVRQTSQGANYNKDVSQRDSPHKGPLYQTPQLPDEVFEGDNTSIRRDPLSRNTENLKNNESRVKRCEECCELPTEMDKRITYHQSMKIKRVCNLKVHKRTRIKITPFITTL